MYEKTLPTSTIIILIILLSFSPTPLTLSSQTTATTTMYVNPQLTTTQIGETFSINISIAQVTNLTAWELKLYYLNTILNGTKATQGPFLKTANSTSFWVLSFTDNYNATHGRVHLVCTLIGTGPGATGSGTLATITFKAKNGGNSPLTLASTKLLDAQDPPQQIPHTTIDGNVQVIGIHDIAVTNVTPLKTIVGQGYSMHINVTVENQGDLTETFNVTLYANTTLIETREVTLTKESSTTLTFTWNTTGFAKGNYTISAYAWPVPGETYTDDNNLTDGVVLVGVPCDVTGPTPGVPDGVCNMRDIGYICNHFGTKPSSPNWDPNCDVTGPTKGVPDGIVNMRDIGLACNNFGNKDP